MAITRLHIESKLLSPTEKGPARVLNSVFRNEDERWTALQARCREGVIIGSIIGEMLTYGGDKHLMWIDIDSRDHASVNEWLRKGPFPQGSFRAIPSTTGKVHVYVRTSTPLPVSRELSIAEWIEATMPIEVGRHLDQVRGPEGRSHAYLPFAAQGRAVMPQKLMEHINHAFVIPEGLRGTEYEEFMKRRLTKFIGQL